MQEKILKDDLSQVIKELTIPGYFGMLGMNIFNIIDTYFVSMLGALQLAAMSFTFSIVMIVNLITIGLGVGIAALVSKAVGNSNEEEKIHVIMAGLFMALVLAIAISIIGYVTIEPFFTWLGADSTTLPYVEEYMRVWYVGCTFLFMSMVGGQIFRGLGDTKTPGNLMIASAVINAFLDPMMIFGFLFVPAMGMSGAALATVISRLFTFVLYYYYLYKKYDSLKFSGLKLDKLIDASKRIFMIGLPNSLTKIANPLIITMVTAILATQSQLAVAGFGVGTKVESFIMALAVAIGNTAMAVLGQNYGANQMDRVKEGLRLLHKFSMIIFCIIYIGVFFLSPLVAKIFTDDPEVIKIVVLYLQIVPLSYPLQSMFQTSTSFYNIMGKPFLATILSFCQVVLFVYPLSGVMFRHFGTAGLFFLITVSYSIVSLISLQINKKLI